jgi:hypothetical protein
MLKGASPVALGGVLLAGWAAAGAGAAKEERQP